MTTKKEQIKARREKSRLAMAELRAQRKAAKLCLWCGDATIGFSYCERCRERGNRGKMDMNRDRYRAERGGVRNYACSVCGASGHNRLTCQTRQDMLKEAESDS